MTLFKQLPDILTLTRIALVPFILFFLYLPDAKFKILGLLIFAVAAITDFWDGHLARKFDTASVFGQFMDPVADKILVSSLLIFIATTELIHPIAIILIISRDIFVDGIRSVAATNNTIISAKPLGKLKTAIQMIAIPIILFPYPIPPLPLELLGAIMIWFSVVLSWISGFDYVWGYIKSQKKTT